MAWKSSGVQICSAGGCERCEFVLNSTNCQGCTRFRA